MRGWIKRSAHRRLAESAIREALARIESVRETGGSRSYSAGDTEYEEALALVRQAEYHLRIGEKERA